MMNKELAIGENHPSSPPAYAYVKSLYISGEIHLYKEAIVKAAASGNRYSEICLETLEKIERNDPIGERYLLGLAWFLKELIHLKNEENTKCQSKKKKKKLKRYLIKETRKTSKGETFIVDTIYVAKSKKDLLQQLEKINHSTIVDVNFTIHELTEVKVKN